MEVIIIGGARERLEWIVFILIANNFVRGYYLQYTNFLSLIVKESVIASVVIPVHVLEKQGGIKAAPVLTKPPLLIGSLTQGNIRVTFILSQFANILLKETYQN